jgi:TonB family protein
MSVAQPYTITDPDWAELPKGEDLAAAYPALAVKLGLEGRAVLDCDVTDVGTLKGCKVTDASPASLGFDQAALAIARSFRMTPRLKNGSPERGGVVTIPINFVLPKPLPDGKQVPTPAPSLVALAVAEWELEYKDWRSSATKLEDPKYRLDPQVEQDGMSAVEEAFDAVRPQLVAVLARERERQFSNDELVRSRALLEGPAGRAFMRLRRQYSSTDERLGKWLQHRIRSEVRKTACAKLDCPEASFEPHAKALVELQRIAAVAPQALPKLLYPTWPLDYVNSTPTIAGWLGVGGAAVVRCEIKTNGEPDTCRVVFESPQEWGFGAAALTVSKTFRFAPGPVDMGIAGRWSIAPVHFLPIPESSEPELEEVPPSPAEKIRIAREIFDATSRPGRDQLIASIVRQLKFAGEGAPQAKVDTMNAALTEAVPLALDVLLERNARAVAAGFTDEELAETFAFLDELSRASRLEARGDELSGETQAALAPIWERMSEIAREKFCAKHACVVGPSTPEPAPQVAPTP